MKNSLKYLFLFFALGLTHAVFGQSEFDSDTTEYAEIEERREIAKREGGSANQGTVYCFYEKVLSVGRPNLQFIDTIKTLFHRYDPIMKDNIFRSNRGNVGLITEDLEYSYSNDLLFSYGKSPFELYRYTPFNTLFYQNVVPYVELNYVLGGDREQNFRMLFAQNILRGLNVGAEYNVIMAPGTYRRTFTQHNNIRVFSNFISKNQNYRAVAGYYYNQFGSNENGGVLIPYHSLERMSMDYPNKKTVPIKLQEAENVWKENSFYLKQSYNFGFNRLNFGHLSHAFEMTRFRTIYDDRQLEFENYPAVFRDSTRTFDSTYVELIRNTVAWNIGDVTSFQSSQFINLSFGATIDFAKVRTGDMVYDTNKSNPVEYYEKFNKENINYLYPFANLRLNYQNRYFLSAGAMYQVDLFYPHRNPSTFSANAGLDYVFDQTVSSDKFFAEVNFSNVLPRPFQEFYIGNSFRWEDTDFENTQTLNLAVGAQWKGFRLKAEHTSFYNYIYLTPTRFEQTSTSFSVVKTTLEKTFRFWKILAFDTRLVYQQNTSETILQLPKFATRSALYFDFNLVGTTPTQIGFEGYYNTPYYSRFYNPALGMFYDQQELETGGFVFVDAFLNMRVKRANLFFKYSNVGADWLGYNYMMTNGYPLAVRAFAFGVLWRFYD